jgi:phage head maturation protease
MASEEVAIGASLPIKESFKMNPIPNGGMEYRYVERSGAPKLENGRLSGRAAPFNKVTMIGRKPWGFREKIMPGAFAKSIKDGDVVLLDNHDHARPISRQSAGTLVMDETKGGLDWDAEPADTTLRQRRA